MTEEDKEEKISQADFCYRLLIYATLAICTNSKTNCTFFHNESKKQSQLKSQLNFKRNATCKQYGPPVVLIEETCFHIGFRFAVD